MTYANVGIDGPPSPLPRQAPGTLAVDDDLVLGRDPNGRKGGQTCTAPHRTAWSRAGSSSSGARPRPLGWSAESTTASQRSSIACDTRCTSGSSWRADTPTTTQPDGSGGRPIAAQDDPGGPPPTGIVRFPAAGEIVRDRATVAARPCSGD